MTLRSSLSLVVLVVGLLGVVVPAQQAPAQPMSLKAAIDQLVSFDFPTRTEAARVVRRTPAAEAVPALAAAARLHTDGYVRYRALVLLAGFGQTSATSTMRMLIGDSNDRIRAVTYGWFQHHPDPEMVQALIAALDREQSEFVRPGLTRALAASHADPAVRKALEPLILRGEDYFRGSVIEGLGDYRATWARSAIESVALLDGPLQDDAILSLGKIGDKASLPVLATLQKRVGRDLQPSVAASSCLISGECAVHVDYLARTLMFAASDPQHQTLLRSAAFALSALAARGDRQALTVLLDAGEPSKDPVRAAVALAVGHVALRNAGLLLSVLETRKTLDQTTDLMLDAFDMLSEDFEEERFFVEIRRLYWAAAEGSVTRRVAQALIDRLEF
ncbi:MAG TPA: HEAT repeat domain-containing protein [Vicinamibacterales bacterium]|nr:HEAT repeat domain-containing protein [Vicinamibacterales bacterium]